MHPSGYKYQGQVPRQVKPGKQLPPQHSITMKSITIWAHQILLISELADQGLWQRGSSLIVHSDHQRRLLKVQILGPAPETLIQLEELHDLHF